MVSSGGCYVMRRTIFIGLVLVMRAVIAATGFNDPPHYLFPYAPEGADNPPLYYTKVCPVGKTDENDAEYVVIGIWYPRFKVLVPNTSFGWRRPYVRGVPEKWPIDFGWMNTYSVEGYDVASPRGFMTRYRRHDLVGCCTNSAEFCLVASK